MIDRICATGNPSLAMRRPSSISLLSEYGSTLVRITHVMGMIPLLSAVTPSFTWATGMYMIGSGWLSSP